MSTTQAPNVQDSPQAPSSPSSSEIAAPPSDRSVVSALPVSQERDEAESPSAQQPPQEPSFEVSSLVGTVGLQDESQNGSQTGAPSPKEEQPASPATLGDAVKSAAAESQKPPAEQSWAALAARKPEPGSVVAPHVTRPVASPQTKPKKEAPARSTEGAGVKQHQPVTSIYVSNLPYELEPQKLQDMFKVFGEIKAVAPSRVHHIGCRLLTSANFCRDTHSLSMPQLRVRRRRSRRLRRSRYVYCTAPILCCR